MKINTLLLILALLLSIIAIAGCTNDTGDEGRNTTDDDDDDNQTVTDDDDDDDTVNDEPNCFEQCETKSAADFDLLECYEACPKNCPSNWEYLPGGTFAFERQDYYMEVYSYEVTIRPMCVAPSWPSQPDAGSVDAFDPQGLPPEHGSYYCGEYPPYPEFDVQAYPWTLVGWQHAAAVCDGIGGRLASIEELQYIDFNSQEGWTKNDLVSYWSSSRWNKECYDVGYMTLYTFGREYSQECVDRPRDDPDSSDCYTFMDICRLHTHEAFPEDKTKGGVGDDTFTCVLNPGDELDGKVDYSNPLTLRDFNPENGKWEDYSIELDISCM